MPVQILFLITVLVPPPIVVFAAVVVVKKGLFQIRRSRQTCLAGLERHAVKPVSHVTQSINDCADAFRIVAQFVRVKGVVVYRRSHVQRHRAAFAGFVRIDVRRRLLYPLRCQMRWPVQCCHRLHNPAVRTAERANTSAAPRLFGNPFDGIVAILSFPWVRRVVVASVTLRAKSAPQVLND